MVVWAAPTGRGKTYALVWVTKTALYQGKKVLFITCEMTKQAIARRVDRCVTHFTRNDMLDDPTLTMERLRALQIYAGELIIIEMMGKQATVENIQAELERLNAEEGFQPDVILVDYPGRMHGVQRYQEREKRHELANIYSDLQIIGREYDAVMHVPMQTNKGAFKKPVISVTDLAECYEVAWMTELMFTLCQTPEEEEEDLMRIYIAKNREGTAHFAAPFKFDKKTGNFSRAGEAVLQADWTGFKRTEEKDEKEEKPDERKRSASG
jgi:replicative DNA helicase